MYFPDLSVYRYLAGGPQWQGVPPAGRLPVLNIGWLDAGHPYPVGPLPEGFLARLALFSADAHLINWTRGVYLCPLCDPPALLEHGGSAEIRVVGVGRVYAAPDLIGHYVEAHGYCPPQEFIAAVLDGPEPGSAAWRATLGLPEDADFTNNS